MDDKSISYCPYCEAYRKTHVTKKKKEVLKVKGVIVKLYDVDVRLCDRCNHEIYDSVLDGATLDKAYKKYEEKTGHSVSENI